MPVVGSRIIETCPERRGSGRPHRLIVEAAPAPSTRGRLPTAAAVGSSGLAIQLLRRSEVRHVPYHAASLRAVMTGSSARRRVGESSSGHVRANRPRSRASPSSPDGNLTDARRSPNRATGADSAAKAEPRRWPTAALRLMSICPASRGGTTTSNASTPSNHPARRIRPSPEIRISFGLLPLRPKWSLQANPHAISGMLSQ